MSGRRLAALLALFAVAVAATFLAAVGLTYWIDPQHERFDTSLFARASASAKTPCLLTTDVVGDSPAIAQFKLDVARARRPTTIVLGVSRALEIRAWPGEKRFANLATPGLGPAGALTAAQKVHALVPGHVTAYVDVESVWFNATWNPFVSYELSRRQRLRRYVSAPDLLASVRFVATHPGESPRAAAVGEARGRCVLHRPSVAPAYPYWDVDGSIFWATGGRRVHADFVTAPFSGLSRMHGLDPARLAQVRQLVGQMRRWGWTVVGFTPPLSPRALADFPKHPAAIRLMDTFRAEMKALFARDGYRYLDLVNAPGRLHCTAKDFAAEDSVHPTAACSARIRRRLDAAAAKPAVK